MNSLLKIFCHDDFDQSFRFPFRVLVIAFMIPIVFVGVFLEVHQQIAKWKEILLGHEEKSRC